MAASGSAPMGLEHAIWRSALDVHRVVVELLEPEAVSDLYREHGLGRARSEANRRYAVMVGLGLADLLGACRHAGLRSACARLGLDAGGPAPALRQRLLHRATTPDSGAAAVAYLRTDEGIAVRICRRDLPLRIGRSLACDVLVLDQHCSRFHCVLDEEQGKLVLRDVGSTNGTIVGNSSYEPGSTIRLGDSTCLVFGSTILWLGRSPSATYQLAGSEARHGDEVHGVCLFDIVGSTGLEQRRVAEIVTSLKYELTRHRARDLLHAKNLGDGLLAVFRKPVHALGAALALRAARGQASRQDPALVRVTLEAGPTHFTGSLGERVGLPLIRAARIEKTRPEEVDQPGADVRALDTEDRLLVGEEMRKALPAEHQQRCRFVGKRRMKGFGDQVYALYVYDEG